MNPVRVGVFDSGVGGLSVLRELRTQLPGAELHYVADSGHAPYGERSDDHVITRSRQVASHLIGCGAHMIVIACNTATALAVGVMREAWPQTPIVGVEPGIKPALAATRNGKIGVMATHATLNSEKFQRLTSALVSGTPLHLRACDGLAAAIERGHLDDPLVTDLIEHHCRPLREANVDTVVLGCTHYTFVQHHIRAALGTSVHIIDTAAAVASHAANTVRQARPDAQTVRHRSPPLVLQTTGDSMQLRRIANAWLGSETKVSRLEVA
jgi:glutamate racemase